MSSILYKLFGKILCTRISAYFETENLWSENQCGFKPGHRTEDNIFIIKTLFEKYVLHNGQKIYVAFVDFKKFFDSINRKFMCYKLLKYGITGKMYNIIKDMYCNTKYQVKTKHGLSDIFSTNCGVKQGCSLSPVLSNIFQNDLHTIFKESCDSVKLNDVYFNSLSWADDLVLISKSALGLQQCLNNLQSYTTKWGLTVNIDKTKVMVMSKGTIKSCSTVFHFNNVPLEYVTSYKYLGLHISSNCKFKNTIKDRIVKANRALFLVRKALYSNGCISPKIACSVFDKQILPILGYGASIWSLPNKTNDVIFKGIESISAHTSIKHYCNNICDKQVSIHSIKKLGHSRENPKPYIVTFTDFTDKLDILYGTCTSVNFNHNDINVQECQVNIDNLEYEKLHTKFCKTILGLNKKANNSGCMSELGRFPVSYTLWKYCVTYWQRLVQGTANNLLNHAYEESKKGNFSWLQNIQALLFKNGLGHIWKNSNSPNFSHKRAGNIFFNRMKDQFIQNWSEKQKSFPFDSKLSILKDHYGYSNYLDKIHNQETRNVFVRLRLGYSILNASMGRFKNNNIKQCKCMHDKETVEHLLFVCHNFSDIRKSFYENMDKKITNFSKWENKQKLRYLLNFNCPSQHKIVENHICSFIKNMYNLRKLK